MMVALALIPGFAYSAFAEDITAAVRAANAATFGLTGGTEYSASYPISKAFDGLYNNDNARAMISPASGYPLIAVYYHISDDFCPGTGVVVTAFTMRRSPNNFDSERTPLRMRLEASPSGDANADDWVLLAENYEDFPGCESGHTPTEDEISFTVGVPRFRQGAYRHYRFVFNPRPTFVNTLHELFLEGDVSGGSIPERLTWNGGSASWDASTQLWKNKDGTSVSWKSFSSAVSSNSLTTLGAKDVAALDFGNEESLAVSGDQIRFVAPAGIGLRNSATLSVDVGSPYGQDTETACVTGTRQTDYTYLPRDTNKTGHETIWWQNRRLRDITGFAPAVLWYSGDRDGVGKACGAKDFVNDGQNASIWFWRYYASGNVDLRHAWIAAKVQFRQVGDDIAAKVVRGGYVWVDGYDLTQGAEIDYEAKKNSLTADIYDDSGALASPYVGVKNLLAQNLSKPGLEVVNTRHPGLQLKSGERLPADAEDSYTGSNVLFATNMRLSEMTDFSSVNLWYNATSEPATAHCMKREDGSMTVQFQRVLSTNLLCVKVRFSQEGDDVYAQAIYAKYKNQVTETGVDFDTASGVGAVTIAGAQAKGYGVSDVVPVVRRTVCSFDGDFAIRGAVTADNVDLAFGGDVTIFDAETFAETPIRMKGGSSLSLADGVAATVPGLSVAGAVTLTFGADSSLVIDDLDLAEGAQVNIVGLVRGVAFRVGTAATLSRADLKKFKVPETGMRVVQNSEGYLSVEPLVGMRVLIR